MHQHYAFCRAIAMPDFEGLKKLWLEAGGMVDDAVTAAAIGMAESGGKASAINKGNRDGSWDVGLWQINTIHQGAFGLPKIKDFKHPDQDEVGSKAFVDYLNAPLNNAKTAVSIKNSQGFKAWAAYNNGTYKQFLPKPAKK